MGLADLQQAATCTMRVHGKPLTGCRVLLKWAGMYLRGRPQCVELFPFAVAPEIVETFGDCRWVGCKTSRRSASGGAIRWGHAVLRSWSTVQATMAVSSGEVELYAFVKGAARAKYSMGPAMDFGVKLGGG